MLNDGLLHSTTSQKTNANYLDRQSKFESNVRSYPRKLPLAIAKAHGVWVTDVEGTTYLDCLAGAGTLALGHNHEAIMASLDSFLTSGMPMHTLDLTTAVKDAFSETLLSLLPGQGRDYCLQFCGPSGADAVEAAIKLAKTATGRHNVISFSGAYHGMTHGALALTGNTAPKDAVANLMPGVQPARIPLPAGRWRRGWNRSAELLLHAVHRRRRKRRVAASGGYSRGRAGRGWRQPCADRVVAANTRSNPQARHFADSR